MHYVGLSYNFILILQLGRIWVDNFFNSFDPTQPIIYIYIYISLFNCSQFNFFSLIHFGSLRIILEEFGILEYNLRILYELYFIKKMSK